MRKRDLLSVAIDLPVVGSQENLLVGEDPCGLQLCGRKRR